MRLSKALYSNPKPTSCMLQLVGTSPTLAEIGIDKMLAQMPKQDGGDAKRNSLGCMMQPSESPTLSGCRLQLHKVGTDILRL